MLPSYAGVTVTAPPGMIYATDAVLDDLSKAMASAHARRSSKGSNTYRPGNAMRVAKPASANNSPRSNVLQARRRTLVGDGFLPRRNHPMIEQSYLPTPAAEMPLDLPIEYAPRRTARPLSWHPTTQVFQAPIQLQQQQQQQQQPQPLAFSQYPFPSYTDAEYFRQYPQFPPTPLAYSGQTSPSSAFSPLSLPYSTFDVPHYFSTGALATPAPLGKEAQPIEPTSSPCAGLLSRLAPRLSDEDLTQQYSAWNNPLVAHSLPKYAAPPTPDALPSDKNLCVQSVPTQPLQTEDERVKVEAETEQVEETDEDDDGEVLYGMGLYDPPDVASQDLTRAASASGMSTLLCGDDDYAEAKGKGLKLEAAWEPPAVGDDEEAEGEDDDED